MGCHFVLQYRLALLITRIAVTGVESRLAVSSVQPEGPDLVNQESLGLAARVLSAAAFLPQGRVGQLRHRMNAKLETFTP